MIFFVLFHAGCYNRRHRRSASTLSAVGHGSNKNSQRRNSQDPDEPDDDSLAAGLLVSTVQNLKSLCALLMESLR